MNVCINMSLTQLKLTYQIDRLQNIERSPLPYPADAIQFRTFPDPRLGTGTRFRFVVTSCATPNFPYVPLHGRQIKGFDLLAEYLWPQPTERKEHVACSLDY